MEPEAVAREQTFAHPARAGALDGQLQRRTDLGYTGEAGFVDPHAESAPTVAVTQPLHVVQMDVAHDAGDVDHQTSSDVARVALRMDALSSRQRQLLMGRHTRHHPALGGVDLQDLVDEDALRTVRTVGDQGFVQHGDEVAASRPVGFENVDGRPQTCHSAPVVAQAVRTRLRKRVQVVGGKGGVGRSTIACGLAWKAAEAGEKTLLLEVDTHDEASGVLGVEPARDTPREVFNNLWLCNMTPAGSLEEYAVMVLRFRALYRIVFENRLVRYLLRSIPSLGEFTMAGKFWFHTSEVDDRGYPKYDRIILDAPATGHAITFLSVSRVVADLAPAGRMKSEAIRMAEMIESEQTCLHIVTQPEEMPINEALELEEALASKLRMHPGVIFLNRYWRRRFEPETSEVLTRLADDARWTQWVRAGRSVLARQTLTEKEADRLAAGTDMPILTVPDLGNLGQGRSAMETLTPAMEQV